MQIDKLVSKNIIKKLIAGEDYRIEIVNIINSEFLQYVIEFFKKVVNAKLHNSEITTEWYKKEFLNEKLDPIDIAINSGLNKKTIHNMYNSSTKTIVINAANEHYDTLYELIEKLVENEDKIDVKLTIKLKDVSVDLTMSESLIVINTLAVKRAALRGGLWSSAGKRVEKPLMETLCKLYKVPNRNYRVKMGNQIVDDLSSVDFEREIDFYLIDDEGKEYLCEVKLMGKGNPESADAVIARNTNVFVGDKLSETNKNQLDSLGIEWVEFRSDDGFMRFENALKKFDIPHLPLERNYKQNLDRIIEETL